MIKFFSSPDMKDKDEQIAKLEQEIKRLREHNFRHQLYVDILHDDLNQKHALIMQLKKLLHECSEAEKLKEFKAKLRSNGVENNKLLEKTILEKESQIVVKRKGSLDSQLHDRSKMTLVSVEIEQKEENKEQTIHNGSYLTSQGYNYGTKARGVKQPTLNKKVILEAMENFKDELVTFDNDLKTHAPMVFREIKQFITNKQTFLTQEIYDLIDRCFDVLVEIKYFQEKMVDKGKQKYEKMLECLLFEILYPKLFITDEDTKARNSQLQDKFYVLQNIISFDMLEIPQTLRIPSLYTICEHEMKKLTNYKAPSSKINCFSNCVNNLVDMYYANEKRKPTSDELFPMLVYLVLHANPDNLRSNVEFIYKYIRKNELLGENGFLITNLEAVISFLDSIDGRSLNKGVLEVKSHRGITPAF